MEKKWKVRSTRRQGHELYCSDCRAQVEVRCDLCGTSYRTARWRMVKNQRENWPQLCDDCRQLDTVTVPCDRCGNLVTVSSKVYRGRRHNNQPILCNVCYRNARR